MVSVAEGDPQKICSLAHNSLRTNASASASASAAASAVGDHDATVTVSRVVDGDTIEVSPAVDGNEEVRLIGMDTGITTVWWTLSGYATAASFVLRAS